MRSSFLIMRLLFGLIALALTTQIAFAAISDSQGEAYRQRCLYLWVEDNPAHYSDLASVCTMAALYQKQLADKTSGGERQSHLILEANAFFLGAKGNINPPTEANFRAMAAKLAASRQLLINVRDHAVSPAIRKQAVDLLQNVDGLISDLTKMFSP